MQMADLLTEDRIVCCAEMPSKKRALEQLSELISQDQQKLSSNNVFDSLISRERLGGTGIGYGVAIPHGRVKNCDHTSAAFLKLNSGIDYDSVDNQPVDLLFALLVPEESTDEHLKILANLARMFNDETFREKVRQSNSAHELYQLITEYA